MQEPPDPEEEEVGDEERRHDVVRVEVVEPEVGPGLHGLVPGEVGGVQGGDDGGVQLVGLLVVGVQDQPVGWNE